MPGKYDMNIQKNYRGIQHEFMDNFYRKKHIVIYI